MPSTRPRRATDYATVVIRFPEISNDLEVVRLFAAIMAGISFGHRTQTPRLVATSQAIIRVTVPRRHERRCGLN